MARCCGLRLCLVALCIIFAILPPSEALSSDDFFFDLPLQACANTLYETRATDILLRLNGSQAAFSVPHYAGGPIDMDSTLYFQWSSITEYGRTTERCAPSVNTLVYNMALANCMCSISSITGATNGVLTTGVELTVSNCPAPQQNVLATASFVYTNVTVVETYNNTMPGSPFDSFDYVSPAGNWKFSIHIEGWNWNASSAVSSFPNNTYVAAEIQMGFESKKNMSVSMALNPLSYSVHTTFGTTDLILTMDLGLLLDDRPAIPDFFNAFPNLSFPQGTSFLGANMPLTFCEPTPTALMDLVKWNKMFSDPSLEVIFGSFSNEHASNVQKQKDKTVAIAASVVVVAVVVILAAIVVGVLLYRKSVNPFSAAQRRALREPKIDEPPSSAQSPAGGPGVDGPATSEPDTAHPSWRIASKPIES